MNAAFGDFSWIRGTNYLPSYAATPIEIWMDYDEGRIGCELGYAERLGFNCIRVWLHSLVYHHDPDAFLKRFEHLLATADAHGMKVMPILFDSCFGVAPSMTSRHMWVANPGPDRMAPKFWPESEAYLKDLVTRHANDTRIALWDAMNEPTATPMAGKPEGKAQIDAFAAHACQMIRALDSTHAVTVGVATTDNSDVVDFVDVLSAHSYLAPRDTFVKDLAVTRDQAQAAGKPWIVTECCNAGVGNDYEMVLPVLREYGVGYYIFELMIGRLQFNTVQGVVYPDGTVRRRAQIEAILDGPAGEWAEKPDEEGVPLRNSDMGGRALEYLQFMAETPTDETGWRERNTLVETMSAWRNVYGDGKDKAEARLEAARRAYGDGDFEGAFTAVDALLGEAHAALMEQARNS